MKVSHPLAILVPKSGIFFAESVHAQDFRMLPRADAYHKLLYVLQGRVSYREEDRSPHTASTGSMLAIPAGVHHEIRDQIPSTLLLLCVAPSFLNSEAELPALWHELESATARCIVLSRPSQHQVEALWRRALLERLHARPGNAALSRALAVQMLVLLARLPAMRHLDTAGRVAAVAREVGETFYDEWNLDRAAIRAGTSRRHFTAQFRRLTGHTFGEHLVDLRLGHAATLLRAGEHSVAGVVFACGFGDLSQFYRLFRQRFKLPPKEWSRSAAP